MCANTVLIFALDGHTVPTPWSLCCVHVRLIKTVYRAFLSIFRAWLYIRISVVNIFCLSSLLFMGHVPEIKID